MFKHSFIAYFISLISTIILINIFKDFKVYIAIGASSIAAMSILYWLTKIEKRIPPRNEFRIFYTIYAILVFATFSALIYFSASKTTPGIATMLILAVSYPGFMSLILNEKMLAKELRNQNGKTQSKSIG